MLVVRFLIALLLTANVATAAPQSAQPGCTATWGRGKLKSYKQVEDEVLAKHGQVKILRIVLCGVSAQKYFQVTILNSSGTVQTMTISAR